MSRAAMCSLRKGQTLPGGLTLLLLVALTTAGPAGCRNSPPLPPSSELSSASVPAMFPKTWTSEEREILDRLRCFYATLTQALQFPQARDPSPEEIARSIRQGSDPARERFAQMTPAFRALAPERRELLLRTFVFDNLPMLQRFIRVVGAWTEQFEPADKADAFRPVLRDVLRRWHEQDALWVFQAWSEPAVEELIEWTLTDHEKLERLRERLQRKGRHPAVMLQGTRTTAPPESSCGACHAGEERERGIDGGTKEG